MRLLHAESSMRRVVSASITAREPPTAARRRSGPCDFENPWMRMTRPGSRSERLMSGSLDTLPALSCSTTGKSPPRSTAASSSARPAVSAAPVGVLGAWLRVLDDGPVTAADVQPDEAVEGVERSVDDGERLGGVGVAPLLADGGLEGRHDDGPVVARLAEGSAVEQPEVQGGEQPGVAAIAPELLGGRHVSVRVETDAGPAFGATSVDWWSVTDEKPNALYITDVDADAYYALLTARLP